MPVSCVAMACAAVVGPEGRFFDMWLSLARAPVVGDIVVCGSAGAVALGVLWHESPWWNGRSVSSLGGVAACTQAGAGVGGTLWVGRGYGGEGGGGRRERGAGMNVPGQARGLSARAWQRR